MTSAWQPVLTLGPDRSVAAGSPVALVDAVRRGADLRVYTEFVFEEHIVPGGDGDPSHDGLIREVIDFRETLLVDDRWAAGITTLRQALNPPFGFNGQPRMSFFLYQQDGRQACANVLFGGLPSDVRPGVREELPVPEDMAKMSAEVVYDLGTGGPSRNFVYDMEVYRFFVRDEWEELLACGASGEVLRGSVDAIEAAQVAGLELKVAIGGLGADLGHGPAHELFTSVGSGFFHTRARLYTCSTHPLVRIAPAVPLEYHSFGWDVAWVFLRTDGSAIVRRLDPYSRQFAEVEARFACRWFAR